MTHSPGPWRFHKHTDTKSFTIYGQHGVRLGNMRSEQDARLICAAPELLEALKLAKALCEANAGDEDDVWSTQTLAAVNAAIAKATQP